jgi:hypothetical protein
MLDGDADRVAVPQGFKVPSPEICLIGISVQGLSALEPASRSGNGRMWTCSAIAVLSSRCNAIMLVVSRS